MNQNTTNIGSLSQTQTQTPSIPAARLVLHGGPRRQVRWSEDTIDNEHMNKKKTKICCIFRKTPAFGESSSEDEHSSSSSSSSDSESEDDCCNHDHSHHQSSKPNAYERQPKYTRHEMSSQSATEEERPSS